MDRPWFPKLDDRLRKRVGLVSTVVLLFVAAIGILFFGDALGRSSGYWDAQAERHANHYENVTADEVKRCLAGSQVPASVQECVEKAVKSSHENQRDERDLSAQRQMAKWAWWLLIVTAIQAPLTALGLLFLLITIWQGRETLSLQRDEARPWLVQSIVIDEVSVLGGMLFVGGKVCIKNIGRSPARAVDLQNLQEFKMGTGISVEPEIANLEQRAKAAAPLFAIVPNEPVSRLLLAVSTDLSETATYFYLTCAIAYTLDGNKQGFTSNTFSVCHFEMVNGTCFRRKIKPDRMYGPDEILVEPVHELSKVE